jgi:hypothetical protein
MPITQILLTATVSSSSPPPTVTAVMSLIASNYSGSGTSWPDSDGVRSPGTLVNSPVYQGTAIPKYFTFDRASTEFVQGVAIGDLATWTMEAWFRLTEPLSNSEATSIITTTYNNNAGIDYGNINYTLSNFSEGGSNTNLTVGFFNAGTWYATAGFVPTVGEWYHVVGTYNGNILRQWVNGVLDGAGTRLVTATTVANGGPVRIARRWDGAEESRHYFSGDIAVAKIYNGVLTDQEIVAAWDATKDTYPNYTLSYAGANNVNEGSAQTFTVTGSRITNGTYYWTIETGASDFATTSGEFTITDNTGSFTVTPTADATTEGTESYTVALRSGNSSGPILATSGADINDTSLDPVPPFSLNFPAGNPYLLVSDAQTDWDLDNTYTIEFWSKASGPSFPSAIRTVMSQGPNNGNIDLGYMQGGLLWDNGQVFYSEPSVGGVPSSVSNINSPGGWNGVGTPDSWTNLATTGGTGTGLRISVLGAEGGYVSAIGITTPGSGYTVGDAITASGESSVSFVIESCSAQGLWTHVAFVRESGIGNIKLYYNGVSQTQFNGSALGNDSANLNIGRRAGVDGQGFLGKLAMIRISNTAKYLTNFSPSLSYGVEADTKLMIDSNTPLVDGTGTHTITNNGVAISDDFPSFQSLQFNQPQGDYLSTPANADWNLGTSWTIEFWLKANSTADGSSNMGGGIWGLLNQGGWGTTDSINIALTDSKLIVGQGAQYDDVRYTEPTPGVWTHVAIVNNSGTQTVWYNGSEQTKVSGTFGSANYANSTDILAIGNMSGGNNYFDGKMAMVRISSNAKYTEAFTATTTYGVEGDTRLFLNKVNPTVDSKSHAITNNGVTTSTDFP